MKNKPILQLETDDDMSMVSELTVKAHTPTKTIDFTHIRQNGSEETFTLYPHQLEILANFCLGMKKWIDSGYKEEFKPSSFNERVDRLE
jgi:hypothetical protein